MGVMGRSIPALGSQLPVLHSRMPPAVDPARCSCGQRWQPVQCRVAMEALNHLGFTNRAACKPPQRLRPTVFRRFLWHSPRYSHERCEAGRANARPDRTTRSYRH